MLRSTMMAALILACATGSAQEPSATQQNDAPYWKSFLERGLPIQWNWLTSEQIAKLPKPKIVPATPFRGFAAYKEATRRYAKDVKLGPDGTLLNYVAGMPFPGSIDPKDPQAALKIMWNYDKRYLGDDFKQIFKLNYVRPGGSTTRWIKGHRKRIWYVGRVALEPTPAVEWAQAKDMRVGDWGELTAPSDEAGTIRMGIRYEFDDRMPPQVGAVDDQWVYLPAIRRVRRLTGAQREDPLFGSTIITDEVAGGNDRETLVQTFKLIGETSLFVRSLRSEEQTKCSPDHALIDLPEEIEKRRVWIVEATHKNPKYVYGKMLYYVDQELYVMLMTASSDQKGQPWKRHWAYWRLTEDEIPVNYLSYDLDLQSQWGTAFELKTTPNQGVKPNEISPDRLYRK
ncbi:MAG: DUF1329 domain-containing protein [Planctomycetes bacterium]|nr:DUF1329 domain-containing protein [Planctomycetota bacterium]